MNEVNIKIAADGSTIVYNNSTYVPQSGTGGGGGGPIDPPQPSNPNPKPGPQDIVINVPWAYANKIQTSNFGPHNKIFIQGQVPKNPIMSGTPVIQSRNVETPGTRVTARSMQVWIDGLQVLNLADAGTAPDINIWVASSGWPMIAFGQYYTIILGNVGLPEGETANMNCDIRTPGAQ